VLPEDFLVNGKKANGLRQTDRLTEWFLVLHFAAKKSQSRILVYKFGYII